MSAWQPIETAPLDWEPILVWAISEDEWDDAQDEERKPVYSAMVARHSPIQQGLWWLCASCMVAVKQPTHWMPLPAPPQDASHLTDDELLAMFAGEALR